MKTLVIQSYRTENVPRWIARCMESVRAWAALHGFDYQMADDSSFALCGAEYLARVGRNMRSITNLSRLELIRLAHQNGYERAIWLDADVLVFNPTLFTVDIEERYAFAAETWIEKADATRWRSFQAVNNCMIVCMRGEPDLDFLIATTRHIALNRRITTNYQVGGDLIKGLRASLDYATIDSIGMFSKYVVAAIASNDESVIAMQALRHKTPVFAANLCATDHHGRHLPEHETMRAMDRLLATRGDVVNRWLLRSSNNLLDGKPHRGMARNFSRRENVALQFRQAHGREPNLESPKTFNERIAARKLRLDDPVHRTTTDKLAVREYVSERIGKQYLIPLLQVLDRPDDFDPGSLPDAFIVKPNHGSGWYEIVRDKSSLDAGLLREQMGRWLRSGFATCFFEPQYQGISPKILVEQLLLTSDGQIPVDYKLSAMNGHVAMIQMDVDRPTKHKRSLFSRSWRRLAVQHAYPTAGDLDPPQRLGEMIDIAERLAAGFEFLRVDLYEVDGRIYFGELTHTPDGGIGKFNPAGFDAVLGRIWETGEAIPEKYFADGAARPDRDTASVPAAAPAGTKPRTQATGNALVRSPRLNPDLLLFNALSHLTIDARVGVNELPERSGTDVALKLGAAPEDQTGPVVSCLMVTQNRPSQARLAINCYRRQTWRARELVVIDTSRDSTLRQWVESLSDSTIRIIHMPGCTDTLGALRNLSIEQAAGPLIAQWDDDDLSHPARLEAQIGTLRATDTRVSLLCRELMWVPAKSRLALLRYRSHENTLICEKAILPRYAEVAKFEDTPVINELKSTYATSYLDVPELYLYVSHGSNTWDDEHMEKIWTGAFARFSYQEYVNATAALARCYPLREYRQVLAARAPPRRTADEAASGQSFPPLSAEKAQPSTEARRSPLKTPHPSA